MFKFWQKYKKYLIGIVGIVAVSYAVGAVLASLSYGGARGAWVLIDKRTWAIAGLGVAASGILLMSREYDSFWSKRGKKILRVGKEKVETNLEGSAFLSEEERDQYFVCKDIGEIGEVANPGVIVRAEEIEGNGFRKGKRDEREGSGKGKTYEINFSKGAHTMVIGTTGSGKTTGYINPVIRILAGSGMKPSMMIADPKGELTALHKKALEGMGYEVRVVDLRSPFESVKWNPLSPIYKKYQRMLKVEDEIDRVEERGIYLFGGKEYRKLEDAIKGAKVLKQRLYDEAYEDLHDIISGLCPVVNKHEPIWESGARNFALAIALAMLEDSEIAELNMSEERFNLYNLTKIATDNDKNCAGLKKYFSGRGVLSKAVSLSRQILTSADNTRNSYLTTLYDKLGMFSDMGICSMTSANEIDFSEMALRPVAVFLQIPDEKETRHTLATIMILQAYKELVGKANEQEDLTLKRSVYFILDEFGNLPPIHKIEQMITVGRSRNIWLTLVVQSYAQLAKVYEDDVAEIIKANCNVQIFIGTTDQKTLEDFSKRCGNYAVMKKSVGTSTKESEEMSENFSVEERPLIYPSELQKLNNPGDMGNAIVTVFGYNPLKTKFTPSFKCSFLDFSGEKVGRGEGRYFDEENTYYDMKKRNVTVEFLGITPIREKDKKYLGKDIKLGDSMTKIFGLLEGITEEEEREEILFLIGEGNIKTAVKKIGLIRDREIQAGNEEIGSGLIKVKELLAAI